MKITFKPYAYSCLIAAIGLSLTLTSCKEEITNNNDIVDTNIDITENNGYVPITAPIKLTSKIPVDVDPAIQKKLIKDAAYYELNEAFNEYSWQALVAINWPKQNGKAMPNFTDKGDATWLGWKEAFQVYRSDAKKPAPWGSPRTDTGLGITNPVLADKDKRIISRTNTPTKNIADETDQAFAGKLFDQNGNVVVYEVLMNKKEFDYVLDNKLYNINGQIEFSKNKNIANFPKGNYAKNDLGAIEIKFAWKILEDTDYKDRYFTDEGYIIGKDGSLELKQLGMIGMHISQKTPMGKQWVWSTFEHVDNLRQNVIEKEGKTIVIHPTLRDPDCEICPENVDVTNNSTYAYNPSGPNNHGNFWTISSSNTDLFYAKDSIMRTQAKRMVDIPVRVQQLNSKMQAYFKKQKSVWQYYELIDTQYPRDQNVGPAPNKESNYHLPKSVTNKPGGDPNLALLTNMTMETFFQKGNQPASDLMEANPPSNYTISGTESCMGCHSSAGLYNSTSLDIYGKRSFNSAGQLSGDFSWLLGRAQWLDESTK